MTYEEFLARADENASAEWIKGSRSVAYRIWDLYRRGLGARR
jgi:hypothetical protein